MTQQLELPLLNIDSQAQLISRLQFLSRFASNFIHVSGDHGAGKTQIAHQYLEYSESNQNCALVSCRPNQKDGMLRTMILQQLFREPLFDANDKLLDSFERMQGNESCDVVIVVDDAHCLSFDLFSELWSLTQEAAVRSTWKINIILFSQKELLKRYISQIEQIGDSKIIEIDIAPLTLSESEQFLSSMQAIGVLSEESLRHFQEQMTERNFVPGELLSMAKEADDDFDVDELTSKPVVIKKKSHKGIFFTLILFLLVAGIGSAFWWMPEDTQNKASQMLHQIFDEQEDEQVANSGAELLASKDGVKLSDLMQEREKITAAELPQPITNDGVTLESSTEGDNKQRVIVAAEVVDTLVEKEEVAQEQGAEVISEGVEESSVTSVVEEEEVQPSVVNVDSFINTQLLLTRNSRHFTLQFSAASDLTTAMEFIETTKIKPQDMQVYRAKHNDTLWYIFVSGDYQNMEQARRAVVTLPQTLQEAKPWVKSYRKVKEEINQVK